jgi:Putative cyclase
VRLIDLSREIAHRMPVHPAHPTVAVGCWNDHDEIHRAGNTTVTSKSLHLSLGDHAGTHVDAPAKGPAKAPQRGSEFGHLHPEHDGKERIRLRPRTAISAARRSSASRSALAAGPRGWPVRCAR